MKTPFLAIVTAFIGYLSVQSAVGASTDMIEDAYIGGSVSRSTFTSAVVKREPVDHVTTVDNKHPFVYFFTELKGMTGQTVTHRWEHNGEIVAESRFDVGAPKWRIWSARVLPPNRVGEWTVSVINAVNEVVHSRRLDYIAAH